MELLCAGPSHFPTQRRDGRPRIAKVITNDQIRELRRRFDLHDRGDLRGDQSDLEGILTNASLKDFQPMKANMGILPPLSEPPKGKRDRAAAYAERALTDLRAYLTSINEPLSPSPQTLPVAEM